MKNKVDFKLLLNKEPFVVWKFLTDENLIQQYEKGLVYNSNWETGAAIQVLDTRKGNPNELANGHILEFQKEQLLRYELNYSSHLEKAIKLQYHFLLNDLIGSTELRVAITGFDESEVSERLKEDIIQSWKNKIPVLSHFINESNIL